MGLLPCANPPTPTIYSRTIVFVVARALCSSVCGLDLPPRLTLTRPVIPLRRIADSYRPRRDFWLHPVPPSHPPIIQQLGHSLKTCCAPLF